MPIPQILNSRMWNNSNIRNVIKHILKEEFKNARVKIDECIIAGGQIHGKEDYALVKTRDRNYKAKVKVVRELIDNGTELLYMIDLDTGYAEGMNSHGIGIVNSALLVSEDEKAADAYWKRMNKKDSPSNDGPRIYNALKQTTLASAIKELISFESGLKGHTIIGNAEAMYSVEMTSKHNPIVKKLDPSTGFDVRTNHGQGHSTAGYTPESDPEAYMSSKLRKLTAEIELNGVTNSDDLAPALAKQSFEKENPHNMVRRTDSMRTVSQIAMNLDKKIFSFYLFPNECTYNGLEDKTPDEYTSQIKFKLVKWNETS